jgi:hypothetical protein
VIAHAGSEGGINRVIKATARDAHSPGLEFHPGIAVRYLPAVGTLNVCGDWYDVVPERQAAHCWCRSYRLIRVRGPGWRSTGSSSGSGPVSTAGSAGVLRNWKTVYDRHRRWPMEGMREKILDGLRAGCDDTEGRDWALSVDSTVVRPISMLPAPAANRPPTCEQRGVCRSQITDEPSTNASGHHAGAARDG